LFLYNKLNGRTEMDALVKIITDKTGISQQQATTAVQTVVSFLKEKMPAGLGNQVEAFLKGGNAGTSGSAADNIKDTLGGMFGR
jgi:uncharacterized protein (DUF2267 family)